MTTRGWQILRWTVLLLLLAGACWSGNLALFNWWAAGGPPTAHPEIYEHRGNVFFGVTLLFLLLGLALLIVNLRRSRTREKS